MPDVVLAAVADEAEAVASPPPTAGWSRYRWSVAAWAELGKAGVFNNVHAILIDGEVYTRPSPGPAHDTGRSAAGEYVRDVCPPGHYVREYMSLLVGDWNDPGPDVAVVRGTAHDYASRTPTAAVWVVEVSDTTLFLDATKKAEVYATAGVQDYWVVDVEGRRLLVYRKPAPLPEGLGATAYRSHEEYGPDDSVAPLAAPDKPVKVSDLLP